MTPGLVWAGKGNTEGKRVKWGEYRSSPRSLSGRGRGGSSHIISPARGPRRGAVLARKSSEFGLEHAELGMHTGFSFISS